MTTLGWATVETVLVTIVLAASVPSASAFDRDEVRCRSAISKSGGKLAKAALKAMTGCHRDRDRNGGSADCNSITESGSSEKVDSVEAKLDSSVSVRCTTGTPAAVLYGDCPDPCDGSVPSIEDFVDVADCMGCLVREGAESYSAEVNGRPDAPITDDPRSSCHAALLKSGSKLFNSVVRSVAKCQTAAEKDGLESVDSCTTNPGFDQLVEKAYSSCTESLYDDCAGVTLPDLSLDACAGVPASLPALVSCGCDTARDDAVALVSQFFATPTTTTTTTTSSTTTTTTLPPSHAQCPDLREMELYARVSDVACTNDGDCTPGVCDTGIGRCVRVGDHDLGWNGIAHDLDWNDGVLTRLRLSCVGPPSPGCGQCGVAGIDPGTDLCRCANDSRAICDEPFVADADDCGGATCQCFAGPPLTIGLEGPTYCQVTRFESNVTGTVNVDTGESSLAASTRARIHLGITAQRPCPVCAGKCSHDMSSCFFDSDCGMGNTCDHDTPNDDVRGGVCVGGDNDGLACDIQAINTGYPAMLPGDSGVGGGYSLDCIPEAASNISGAGLSVPMLSSTGSTSITAGVDCDGPGPSTALCACRLCSKDTSATCSSDAECTPQGGFCSSYTSPIKYDCTSDTECASVDLGTCTHNGNTRCSGAWARSCSVNADCQDVNAGSCSVSTCSSSVFGASAPYPNRCDDGTCVLDSGEEGECATGPDDTYCDSLVRADGSGIVSCQNDTDCDEFGAGDCSLVERRNCYLDPIVAGGTADPEFPVLASAVCVGPGAPSGLFGINSTAGLPGPARSIQQFRTADYCASDHGVQYTPGGGSCPP